MNNLYDEKINFKDIVNYREKEDIKNKKTLHIFELNYFDFIEDKKLLGAFMNIVAEKIADKFFIEFFRDKKEVDKIRKKIMRIIYKNKPEILKEIIKNK